MSDQRASRRPNEHLKRERELRGWRQQDVADHIGTDGYTVNRWERGRATPSPYFRQQLCDLFGKNAEELGLLRTETNVEPHLPSLSEVGHPAQGGEGTSHAQDSIALPPYWNVPSQRNPFFTGREQTLRQLHQLLGQQQSVALTQSYALSGLGGIGKTQAAVEYAYRSFQDYSAVFWLGAETPETIMASFVSMARCLDLPEKRERDQSKTVAAVIGWLNSHKHWLLIVDNVEDLELVKRALPTARCGCLLFTTRLPALGTLACMVEVEPMSPDEGSQLLLRRAGSVGPQAALEGLAKPEESAMRTLATALDGLPLALDQAGAYIQNTRCGWAEFLHLFETSPMQVLNERDASADHPLSVVRMFTLSFERLHQANPAAADLLTLCCFLAPEAIPLELVTQGAAHLGTLLGPLAANDWDLNQVLATLQAYSLVRRDRTSNTLFIHRLVQAVLREKIEEAERRTRTERAVWLRRIIAALGAVFPEVTTKSSFDVWRQCERLLPHVLVCATALSDQAGTQNLAEVLRRAADYLQERAQYEQAEPLYQRALRIQEQMVGPEHLEVASSLQGLAILNERQGKYEQAEPLYQRALHIREQVLGPEHLEVASSINNLGILYAQQGKYERSEPLFEQALHIREGALGPEHPDVANSLYNLAELYHEQRKHKQGEPLFEQALHIWEQALGPEHLLITYPLNGLASLYREQGTYAEAEQLYQRALRIREQQLGPEHPQVAYTLHGLATLYREQGTYAEAELLYQRALRIREQQLGPEHPETAETIHDLARLWDAQGHSEVASLWYTRALAVREQALGASHPKTRETRSRLIALLHTMGKHEEATRLDAAQAGS